MLKRWKSSVTTKDCVTQAVEPKARLPLFAAQLLLLLAYGGLGFLAFKKDEETRKAIAFVTGLFKKGYTKITNLLPSGSK